MSRQMISSSLLVVLLILDASFLIDPGVDAKTATSGRPTKRPIQIINDGKTPFQVYWVNVNTREEVLMSSDMGVLPGTEFPLE